MKVTPYAIATILALCGIAFPPGEATTMRNDVASIDRNDESNDQEGGNRKTPLALRGGGHFRKGELGMIMESPSSLSSDTHLLDRSINRKDIDGTVKATATAVKEHPDLDEAKFDGMSVGEDTKVTATAVKEHRPDPDEAKHDGLRSLGLVILVEKGSDAHLQGKLGLCEGDCDKDSHCEDGLVCFQRDGYEPIPGCVGSGVDGYDYCIPESLVTVVNKGWDAHLQGKLGRCEGDCDEDSHCEDGLKCFQRDGYDPIPGCVGSGVYSRDYCILESLVTDKGSDAHLKGKLGLCEGDCDKDSHCEDGLKCFKRDGYEPIPGCVGSGVAAYDYCIDVVTNSPVKAPVKAPVRAPGEPTGIN